jgi:hypothetical protein
LSPDTRCVLTFRGRPIAISEYRQCLEQFKVDMGYTAAMQADMEITEMVPVLK